MHLFKQSKSDYSQEGKEALASPITAKDYQIDNTNSSNLLKNQALNASKKQKNGSSNLGAQKQSMFKTSQKSDESKGLSSLVKKSRKWDAIKDVYNAQKFKIMALKTLFKRMETYQKGSDKSQATQMKKRDLIYIDPDDTLYFIWKCITGIAMLYYPIMIPIRNCFELDNKDHIVYDYFLDGLFLIDIILNFITGRTEEGVKIQDVRSISKLYLKQEFIYDIIAVFPWQALEGRTNSFGFILLKLLRIRYRSRLIDFLRSFIFTIFGSGKNIQYALLTYNILIILSQVFICVHMLNCIWITLGKFNDGKTSWIQLVISEDDIIQNYIKNIYINGFYYIVTTISTVGFGDISCQTSYEMFFACLCMFFGIALFGYIQGGLVDAIKHSLLSGEIKQSNCENEFQTWLIQREQNIEYPLSSKKLKTMRECFQFQSKYEFSNTVLESEYFLDLPPLDQAKVFVFYFSELVTVYSTFFRNISDVSLTRQIIGALKPVYIPKDTIVQGYLCNSNGIYFIFKGQVIVQKVIEVNDRLELLSFRELSHGSFIGENFLLKKPSKFNYVVDQETDLYSFFISSEKIYQIFEDYPFVLQQLIKFAQFRNKFFKIEGEKVEQQNQIYKTTHLSRKSFFRKQTDKNFEKQMTQQIELNSIKEINNQNRDEENESEQQEDEKYNILIDNKMQLLYQFEKSSEDQKLKIFSEIQSENIIMSLFKQMSQFSQHFKHQRHSDIQNQKDHKKTSGYKSTANRQDMAQDIQQEKQFVDEKSPKLDSLQIQQSEIGRNNPIQQINQSDTNCYLVQTYFSMNGHQNQSHQNNQTLIKSQVSQNKSDNLGSLHQNLMIDDQNYIKSDKNSLQNQIRYDFKKTKQSQFKQNEKITNLFLNSRLKKSNSCSQLFSQKICKQIYRKTKSLTAFDYKILFINQTDIFKNKEIKSYLNKNNETDLQNQGVKHNINQVRHFEVKQKQKDNFLPENFERNYHNFKNNLINSSDTDLQEKQKDEILLTEQSLKSELIPKNTIESQQINKSIEQVELINLESRDDDSECDLEDLQIKKQHLSYFKIEKPIYSKKFLQNLNNQENHSMQIHNQNELESILQKQLTQDSPIDQINENENVVQQYNLQKNEFFQQNKLIEQELNKVNLCQNFSKSSSQINQLQVTQEQPSTQIEQLNSQQNLKSIQKSKNLLNISQINLLNQDCEKEQNLLLFRKTETLFQPSLRFNNHKESGEQFQTTTQNNSENNSVNSSVKNFKRNQTLDKNKQKKYQSDKKTASDNKKKIYQSQIQDIIKQAEIESMSYKSKNQSKKQQNENQQSKYQKSQYLQDNSMAKNQHIKSKSNFIKQINVVQNQNTLSPKSTKQNSPRQHKKNFDSVKHARKVSNEILTPLNQYQYKGGNKSFTVLLNQNKSQANNQEHLSNFKALIQIMNIVRNNKPNEKQQQSDHVFLQNDENINLYDQNVNFQLLSYVQTDMQDEESKYVENILDNSIDVPVEIIDPSFTIEEIDNIFPYLKSTVSRLDKRADDLFKNINDFKVFCLEKIQKIKAIKSLKSAKSAQKNINNEDQTYNKQEPQSQKVFQQVTLKLN